MSEQRVIFSPVTRLNGLLTVEVCLEGRRVVKAKASGTMFRGLEWVMRGRQITDAVYLAQRVCGICSLAHGAAASYLVDDLYGNRIDDHAQLLRNIMYGADIIQNHLRHFYIYSLPDYVTMPSFPPFQRQRLIDNHLNQKDNERLAEHYFAGAKAAQQSHQILAIFGGKAPHQHSFLPGGVSVAPTADKIERAIALIGEINQFINNVLMPDTAIIADAYHEYFQLGKTPPRLLSFGLFKFGSANEQLLWSGGFLEHNRLQPVDLTAISEETGASWFTASGCPDPDQPNGYSWIKRVLYKGRPAEGGPLARMLINGKYHGGTSTMDRVVARVVETSLIGQLIKEWLTRLTPGPPPIEQNAVPIKSEATAVTDAMRGVLLHRARIEGDKIASYDIITPTAWNFSPQAGGEEPGPAESALIGTEMESRDLAETVLGRIIRSFDPCLTCATHMIELAPRRD